MKSPRFAGPELPHDLVAGAVVACLLIPQSVAYAELAGLPAHLGLYASVAPPIAAAFFASSPYLQTGPAAVTSLLTLGALSTVAAPRSAEFIALAALLALVVGFMRLVIGALRWGWIAYLLSPPMMMGFATAAGILIAASQVPAMLGVTAAEGDVLSSAVAAISRPAAWRWTAVGLAAVTIGLAVGGRYLHPLFPGVLVAIAIGLLVRSVGAYDGPVLGDIPHELPVLALQFDWRQIPVLLVPAAVITIIGFAEAVSIARLYAAQERQRWSPDREFVAQGVANLASAVSGGFPVGGSFSRTAANHLAGGRTRWSGAIAGLIVLAVLPFSGSLADVPRAVVGGIVAAAVTNLMYFRQLARVARQAPLQGLVAWATFGLTLALAPRADVAVVAGVILAASVHIWRELEVRAGAQYAGGTLTLTPRGVLFFASAPGLEAALLDELAAHPEAKRLVLRLAHLGRIDYSGALVLCTVAEEAEAAGLDVRIAEVPPQARRIFTRVLGPDSRFLEAETRDGSAERPRRRASDGKRSSDDTEPDRLAEKPRS